MKHIVLRLEYATYLCSQRTTAAKVTPQTAFISDQQRQIRPISLMSAVNAHAAYFRCRIKFRSILLVQSERRNAFKEWVKRYLSDYKAFQLVRKSSDLLLQRSVASKWESCGGKPNLRETRLFIEIAGCFEKVTF